MCDCSLHWHCVDWLLGMESIASHLGVVHDIQNHLSKGPLSTKEKKLWLGKY